MKETLTDTILRLTKEGYEIRIHQDIISEKCVIRLDKDGAFWTRIIPYRLLESGDDFLVYILNLLQKSTKMQEDYLSRE